MSLNSFLQGKLLNTPAKIYSYFEILKLFIKIKNENKKKS